MKINPYLVLGVSLFLMPSLQAQVKESLKLEEAIHLAWKKNSEVSLADSKVLSKSLEVQSVKNRMYPDLKVSGQYQRLTNAKVDLQTGGSSSSTGGTPVVNQLILGQVTASLPIFSGFKLRNSVKASDHMYEAETANALQTKEDVAMRVIDYYAQLYKAQKTIDLLAENKKSAQQRVEDFIQLEKNGIIPRNDLLKAQLQVSKLQLSLDKSTSDLNTLNFELTNFLKLDPSTVVEVFESDFANFDMSGIPTSDETALGNRKDLEAVQLAQKASLDNVAIAKSGYYPTLALVGGYTTLDLKNVINVQNAINFGVGLSYDLSGILKNGTTVKLAKSKADEVKNEEKVLTDYIKIQVKRAMETYELSLKQEQVYTEAVGQATENYRIIKDKYDNGLADTNDLLEADVEQLASKINKTLSKADSIEKYYALLSASGQLNQTFNLSKI
ncbi:TolC family protein [Flavobacterium sp. 7A]|uniref:TolC family protein n=1 Tax=Flavobacterium sp. 7A TaxID=2940571 RepID=UPI0022267F76|nr:TolC family protein [Flavobacterium sp. 7A]MCW2120585.1 outer membrane protein TolC [Flavobacterium sp. 7A]